MMTLWSSVGSWELLFSWFNSHHCRWNLIWRDSGRNAEMYFSLVHVSFGNVCQLPSSLSGVLSDADVVITAMDEQMKHTAQFTCLFSWDVHVPSQANSTGIVFLTRKVRRSSPTTTSKTKAQNTMNCVLITMTDNVWPVYNCYSNLYQNVVNSAMTSFPAPTSNFRAKWNAP